MGSLHLGLAAAGLAAGSVLAVLAARPRRRTAGVRHEVPRRTAVAVLTLLACAAAAAYLSVPDTEGPLVVLAVLLPLLGAAAVGRHRLPPKALAAGALVTTAVLATVTWQGAGGRVSVSGWWAAKAVLGTGALVCVGVLLGAGLGTVRPSGPERPSP